MRSAIREQHAAATRLFEASVGLDPAPQDWHKAWAVGYCLSGSTSIPSTHWFNTNYAFYAMDPQAYAVPQWTRTTCLRGN